MLARISRPLRLWSSLTSSFWFIPVVIITLAIGLAAVLIKVDEQLPPDLLTQWPRMFGSEVEGARAVLSSIAGSMITVAGVVFSITLVALSLASSQYSSRVLRNFIRNRINQVVLGMFLGIFVYCEVVLRAVLGSDKLVVPSLSVLVGLVLGIVGVFVLVIFIHHIATSIQASQILAAVFDETMVSVRASIPDDETVSLRSEVEALPPLGAAWQEINAPSTGYLTGIDISRLEDFAQTHDTVLRVLCGVGAFIIQDAPLVALLGQGYDPKGSDELLGAFSIQNSRTTDQDMTFGIRQLVDVSLKALSPGINDTTTAVMAVDYLAAILYYIGPRSLHQHMYSSDGRLRVILVDTSFRELLGAAFDQVRQNASSNVAVLRRLLDSIETIGQVTTDPVRREALFEWAQGLEWSITQTVPAPMDRDRLLQQHRTSIAPLKALGTGG